MAPPHFCPLNTKIGGPIKYVKYNITICLNKDRARHTYKKVESKGIVNIDTIKQETEENKFSKDDDEVNPHHNIIINNIDIENIVISQMEQWLIISNVAKYVQHDRNPIFFRFRC